MQSINFTKTIVVIAHGDSRPGAFSNPHIKIITKSEQPLSFADAKLYLGGTNFPTYASSSLGSYDKLSDADCRAILGKVPGPGPGLVDTGMTVPVRGYPVYVLRGRDDVSFAEMGVLSGRMKANFVLLACR